MWAIPPVIPVKEAVSHGSKVLWLMQSVCSHTAPLWGGIQRLKCIFHISWLLHQEIVMRFKAEEKKTLKICKSICTLTSTTYRAMAVTICHALLLPHPLTWAKTLYKLTVKPAVSVHHLLRHFWYHPFVSSLSTQSHLQRVCVFLSFI